MSDRLECCGGDPASSHAAWCPRNASRREEPYTAREMAELHAADLRLAYFIAQSLRALPLGEMLRRIQYADSFGPITDPTLYRKKERALREDKTVVEILAEAKQALDKLPWPT